MDKPDGSPTMKAYQDTLLVFLSSGGGLPYDPGGCPLVSQEEVPLVCLDHLVDVPQVHLALQEVVLQVPLLTQDLKAQPDSHSCGKVVPP